jgi:hypothetical protein
MTNICIVCGAEILTGDVITKESYMQNMLDESKPIEHRLETYCKSCADDERADMWDDLQDGPCPYQRPHKPGNA